MFCLSIFHFRCSMFGTKISAKTSASSFSAQNFKQSYRQGRADAQHDIALLQHSNQTEKFPKIIRERHSVLLTVQRFDITPIIMNKFSGHGQNSSLSVARGMDSETGDESWGTEPFVICQVLIRPIMTGGPSLNCSLVFRTC